MKPRIPLSLRGNRMGLRGFPACWVHCPANIRTHGYIALIAQHRFKEAIDLVRREDPLPGVSSRVCQHPCEESCERQWVDQPIAIAHLKRFVADYERDNHPQMPAPVKRSRDEDVAIIGSGPAGLTVAYHLILKGYGVTVFESLPLPGGMLVVGIPPYRLPREVIQYEVDRIHALGVEIKTGVTVGKTPSLDDLFMQGYQAAFIAVGAYNGLKLNLSGEDEFGGVIDSLDFLRSVNLERRRKLGERVCIVGGGNAALDSARTARRLGCGCVTILYRRSRREMPATPWEIAEAEAEGVHIRYLTAPIRIVGGKNRIVGVECIEMRLGKPDTSGRRSPIPIRGSEFLVEADAVISAIGQQPDLSFLPEDHDFKITPRNTFVVDPDTLQTNVKGVFAGGDAVTGSATVSEAIGAGKRAAKVIDRYLRGGELKIDTEETGSVIRLTDEEISKVDRRSRQKMPTLPVKARVENFDEIELGFDEKMAVEEATRCLRCWTYK